MKRILSFAIPIIVLLALVGWRLVQKTTAETQLKQQGAARRNAATVVEVATAGPKSIANIVEAVGSLESPYQVKLSPNISGRIDYLEAREGDPVTQGEVLARIDPQFVEGQILQAEGNLAAAQENLAKTRVTENANTVGIHATIGQDQAALMSAQADFNETKATYDATVGAAHEATVDAEAKVASSYSAIQTAEANLHLAQANLEDAQAKYTRTYNLYIQGFDSPQDLDDTKASVKVNQSTVNAQQKNLDAAKSAWNSTKAEYTAAAYQESVTRKKGLSDIEDARAKVTQALKTLDAAKANISQIPAYAENLRALQSEVVAAQAAVDQAKAQRAYLIVRSKIDGTVTQRLADPGAEATPGSPLLVVQSLKWLFMTAAMPVEYSDKVKKDMPVQVTIDGLPGQVFNSKISAINRSADPASRQFMIRTNMDNASGQLRPGMFAHVQMIASYAHADVAVPREAVTTDSSNNSSVTTVDSGNVAHIVPVTLGMQDANYVQVLSGVNAGDRVVVLAYRAVRDGGKVQIGNWSTKGGGQGKGRNGAPGTGGAPAGGLGSGPIALPSGSFSTPSAAVGSNGTGATTYGAGTSANGATGASNSPSGAAGGGSRTPPAGTTGSTAGMPAAPPAATAGAPGTTGSAGSATQGTAPGARATAGTTGSISGSASGAGSVGRGGSGAGTGTGGAASGGGASGVP